jgi:hypothetical protein
MLAFFSTDVDGSLLPEQLSTSPWSNSQVGGYAVCGALARSIERSLAAEEFAPVRLTVDLFRPVRTEPLHIRTSLIRRGPRIEVVDGEVVQDGEVRARASAVFVAPGEEPPGELWHSSDAIPATPDTGDEIGPPLLKSGDGPWSGDFSKHQNADRKSVWQMFPPLVDGEMMSPFQRAALMAETTSLVCHWGSEGAGFINIDTTLALTRLPIGTGLGLRADNQTSHRGVSVGTATMFDRHGVVGNCTVTAIANARRQVDLGSL